MKKKTICDLSFELQAKACKKWDTVKGIGTVELNGEKALCLLLDDISAYFIPERVRVVDPEKAPATARHDLQWLARFTEPHGKPATVTGTVLCNGKELAKLEAEGVTAYADAKYFNELQKMGLEFEIMDTASPIICKCNGQIFAILCPCKVNRGGVK